MVHLYRCAFFYWQLSAVIIELFLYVNLKNYTLTMDKKEVHLSKYNIRPTSKGTGKI